MYEALDEPVELLHEPLFCGSCHEDKHKGILDMFKGTGARGVASLPSPMRKAHVGCSGCHIVPDPAGGMRAAFTGMNMIAVQAACQSCHPSIYAEKVGQWKREISAALLQAEKVLEFTESRLTVESYGETDTRRTMENIRHNILFVRNSAPIHNRDYAVQVLEKAVRDLSSLTENTRQR
jgi:nitrate/TMAO reductase-like tetraheme cytochrome c subunit